MVPRNLYRTDQIIRRIWGQAKKRCYLFIWQDCQSYPVDAESAKGEDRTCTRAYMCMIIRSEGRERANGDRDGVRDRKKDGNVGVDGDGGRGGEGNGNGD